MQRSQFSGGFHKFGDGPRFPDRIATESLLDARIRFRLVDQETQLKSQQHGPSGAHPAKLNRKSGKSS